MVKLYLIEEKGRTLSKEFHESILSLCSKNLHGEDLDYTGGHRYLSIQNLLEEIEKDSKNNYIARAIAFIYNEGEMVFICAGNGFHEFVNIAKKEGTKTTVCEILKELAERHDRENNE